MRSLTRLLFPLLTAALLTSLTAGCSAKARTARHLQRADNYFAAGQYAKAEIEYLNVLQRDRLNARAFGRLGTIYYEQGRLGHAYAFLTNACALTTNDTELHLKVGTIYLGLGRLKEAREQATLVLAKMPTHAEAPVLLAETATNRMELDELRQRLEKLSAQVGDTAPLQLAFGTLSFRGKDFKAAEASFKRALAIDSKSSAAHFALGNLALFQNDLTNADTELKAAAELSPVRSARRLTYADFKIKTGELSEGKRLLAEITKAAPDYLPAWIRQADIAFAERNYTNCTALLSQALARDSVNYDALLLRGRLWLAQTNADKAIVEFENLSRLYENSAPVHYHLALACLMKNDISRALKSLNQAVTLEPNYAEATLLLAELNIRKGNAAPAISSLTQLVKRRPQLPQAHLLLANAYLVQKDLNEAVAVYTRMLTLFPKSPQVPVFLGVVLAQQNKPAEARKAFEKSLELAPDYLPALEQLIDLDLAQKQYDAALERARKQVEKDPKAATPNVLLAKVHMAQALDYARQQMDKLPSGSRTNLPLSAVPEAQADVAQAETALLKAIELDPNLQPAYLLLAQLYVASNKHQQALARLNALVAKTNNVAALMQIGMIHNELKDFSAAREAYEKLLMINPRFSPALNNLAYLYSEHLQQPDKAYEMANKARQLQPADPHTADTLGWILFKRGEYTRALGLVQESASSLPAEPEVQYHLGMIHYMLGEEEPARVALQTAAQGTKEFPGKEEVARRLALLAIEVKTADPAVVADLEKRLSQEPNDPVVAARLAAMYERDGAFEKAAGTYETVRKLNPQNARILGRLARLYSTRLNDPRKALELAKDAHSLAPDDTAISYVLGRLVYQQGDYKWALSLLQETARKIGEQPDVQYDFAWACYSMGRVPEAEAAMQDAAQAGAALSRLAHAQQFLTLVAASKSPAAAQQAAAQAQQVLATNSDYVPAVMISALLQEQQGKYDDAKRLYEKVLGANALFIPAARNLTVLDAQHFADDPAAYQWAVKARESYPEDSEVARALGIIVYRRSDYSRAAQLLAESAQKQTSDGELWYYLGMSHYRLKHPKESKDALNRALALNIPTKQADDARRVLAELK